MDIPVRRIEARDACDTARSDNFFLREFWCKGRHEALHEHCLSAARGTCRKNVVFSCYGNFNSADSFKVSVHWK